MAKGWRGEGLQHQGARPYQEDRWHLSPQADGALLAVVADGMGGHAGGAVASQLVVDAVARAMEHGGSLKKALAEANQAVGEGAAAKAALKGMGSTLVAVLVKDNDLSWISVGDSPLYLLSQRGLARLNADHSMAPQIDKLVAQGVMTAEEAANHPGRHTLRDAVMGERLTLIDEGHCLLEAGDRVLLCSDGIHSLTDERIADIATGPLDRLIKAVLVMAKPHQDNVTVVKLERMK